MKRKLSILIGLVVLGCSMGYAQDYDDIYYDSSKQKKTEKAEKQKATQKQAYNNTKSSTVEQDYYNSSDFDVDAYNRRGSYSKDYTDTLSAEGQDNFVYTDRIKRFHNANVIIETNDPDVVDLYYVASSPRVNLIVGTPTYYVGPSFGYSWRSSLWYDSWYWPSYYSSWYGPSWYSWYGPSWYGGYWDPWYCSSWGWHGHYHGWGHPSHGWGHPSYGWHDSFRPGRTGRRPFGYGGTNPQSRGAYGRPSTTFGRRPAMTGGSRSTERPVNNGMVSGRRPGSSSSVTTRPSTTPQNNYGRRPNVNRSSDNSNTRNNNSYNSSRRPSYNSSNDDSRRNSYSTPSRSSSSNGGFSSGSSRGGGFGGGHSSGGGGRRR